MAVYTHVSAEDMAVFLARYDVGTLVSAKGIAEGVENSNYLIDTDRSRFILTLYEKRVDAADLPYFLGLTSHLSSAGLPVPAPVPDRSGEVLQDLAGKKACLIEFLNGVSITTPDAALAEEAGSALGRLHLAAAGYEGTRGNSLSIDGWQALARQLHGRLDEIEPGLDALVGEEVETLARQWPHGLPRGTIHADLFPDNVLVQGGRVTGIIDFYFACTDLFAYDLAVTLTAWAFDAEGRYRGDGITDALIAGYERQRRLTPGERDALDLLCRGASLRFLLTRAYDWLHTPPGALVTRKDPRAFLRRLEHYRA